MAEAERVISPFKRCVKDLTGLYVGLSMKTRVKTIMSPGNHNKPVPVSTYTCPNGNVLTFRGGDSEKVLKGVQAVEALGLSRFELQTLRTLLDNL